ncbi:type VI secretion system Vgr family protein [Burkholderia territorii]
MGDRKERGQGAELRTDGHLAARVSKGMLLTTDANSHFGFSCLRKQPCYG